MLKTDYLIVGQGVAGSCLALKLLQENKTFRVIDHFQHNASCVAVGVYNPVVLKRFALIWQAQHQLDLLKVYFEKFEQILHGSYLHPLPTFRILSDENEIHAWRLKAESDGLEPFLNPTIFQDVPENFKMSFGYAEVKQTGRVDLGKCLKDFRKYLENNNLLIKEKFHHNLLKIKEKGISYQNIEAEHIVFCEGFGIKENPYFNYLPIIGVKGEVLKIKTETPVPPAIWKASTFLMPLEGNFAFTASTYDRDDLTPVPSEKGKKEILENLEKFYKGSYEVVDHLASIRPTVRDRRPVIGTHPLYQNVHLLNGMGTRGTLLGPAMAEELYNHLELGKPLDKEADLRRFTQKFFQV